MRVEQLLQAPPSFHGFKKYTCSHYSLSSSSTVFDAVSSHKCKLEPDQVLLSYLFHHAQQYIGTLRYNRIVEQFRSREYIFSYSSFSFFRRIESKGISAALRRSSTLFDASALHKNDKIWQDNRTSQELALVRELHIYFEYIYLTPPLHLLLFIVWKSK